LPGAPVAGDRSRRRRRRALRRRSGTEERPLPGRELPLRGPGAAPPLAAGPRRGPGSDLPAARAPAGRLLHGPARQRPGDRDAAGLPLRPRAGARLRARRHRAAGAGAVRYCLLALLLAAGIAHADDQRPVPDYQGRGDAPTDAGDVLIWVPRVVFAPVYFVAEYV